MFLSHKETKKHHHRIRGRLSPGGAFQVWALVSDHLGTYSDSVPEMLAEYEQITYIFSASISKKYAAFPEG